MRAIAIAALLAMSGCSVAFMKDPPNVTPPKGTFVDCTEGKALPVLDFVLTGASIAGGIAMVQLMEQYDAPPNHYKAAAVTSLFALPWLLAGVAGMYWSSKCHRVHVEQNRS
jgi:hypothetical protein